MIKDSGDEFDDYSISPKVRQILLQLKKKICCNFFSLRFLYFFLLYKNELLSIQQTRNIAKSKKNNKKNQNQNKNKQTILKGNCLVLFTEQRSN